MYIFLSGGEVYREYLVQSKHQNFFTTFFYPKNAAKFIDMFYDANKRIIVDSGAFTFIAQRYVSAASPVKGAVTDRTSLFNLNAYVREYCNFIDQYKNKVFSFIELDVDMIFGKEKVMEMRAELYKHAGDKLMACYHSTMGQWEQERNELFKYKFVGIEGIHSGGQAHVDYIQVVKDCYEANKFVHVFAMTKQDFLQKVPICSTDSTSWNALVKYGRSILDRKTGLLADFVRYRMRRHKKLLGPMILAEVDKWAKLEKEITDLWNMRGIDWNSKLKGYNL